MEPVILSVPYLDQSEKFPTGCESVSAVMLLNYLGYELDPGEFIDRFLEKEDFQRREGWLWGADPWERYCGSPYSEDGFGCYAPVICRALERALDRLPPPPGGPAYRVVDETDTPVPRLLTEYIDRGLPVIFWACIDMRPPIMGPNWRLLDSGKLFTWISNEHCLLLVGYDAENYYFNDPYENRGLTAYPRKLTELRHAAQYSMAVGVKPIKEKTC